MVALPPDHIWGPSWAFRESPAWEPTPVGDQMRIPKIYLDGPAFLYRTRDEAERHARIGGTCFCIAHPLLRSDGSPTGYHIPYMVTNKHVSGMCPVIRVNRRDGGKPDIIELEERDWIPHPDGDDVSITPVIGLLDENIHKISFGKTDRLITEKQIDEWDIGIGDEVFMVGRFVNHQGKLHNSPAVRLGAISMMPEPIWNKAVLKEQLSYAVEMRSRTGFSGSMVVAYRTPATVLEERLKTKPFVRIIGVNWGHIVDEDTGENTWLNGVVPAWKILDIFGTERVHKIHEDATLKFIDEVTRSNARGGAEPSVAMPEESTFGGEDEVAPESDNPDHKEDFMRLLNAAGQKRPQDCQT
jgi:hypothetical protein